MSETIIILFVCFMLCYVVCQVFFVLYITVDKWEAGLCWTDLPALHHLFFMLHAIFLLKGNATGLK